MNELDSELIQGRLQALGYTFTTDAEEASVLLYNTCSVREMAEQKVWSRLGEVKFRKAKDPALVVGVLGCMAERDGEDLINRMPVVDIMAGPGELDKVPALIDNAVRTNAALAASLPDGIVKPNGMPEASRLTSARQVALQGNTSRRSTTLAAAADSLELLDLSRSTSPVNLGTHSGGKGGGHSAYVRITRGCNKFCTYCVVPFTRGAEIHRPPQHIIDECKQLADSGVIEITLLGQTVNHYRFEHGASVSVDGIMQPQKGRAFKGGHRRDPLAGANTTTFADLLQRIHDEVPSIKRIRFVTSYPRDFGDDVLEVMRDHPRICRYLHVPAQTGSNRMLKKMNRGYTIEEYYEFLDRARHYLHQPEINRPLALSGDIIVGFPTETDEDFQSTIELLERSQYKNCFIFKYSPRPGTVAYDKIPDDIPESVKRTRNNALLAIQNSISENIALEYLNSSVDVFIEGLSKRAIKQRIAAPSQPSGTVQLTIGGASDSDSDHACSSGACGTSNTHVLTTEEQLDHDPSQPVQLTGRTDGDIIVHFDAPIGVAPDDLIGTIRKVNVTDTHVLSLLGTLAD